MGYGNNAPPIGTIVPYAGPINANKLAELQTAGWYLCQGDLYNKTDFPDLKDIIGNNFGGTESGLNLPDLQGTFIRGWAGDTNTDPDKDTRIYSNTGGVSGNKVGTFQNFATAKPVGNRFVVSKGGIHTHNSNRLPEGNYDNAAALGSIHGYPHDGKHTTSENGAHDHRNVRPSATQKSGDVETRPINGSMHFLIKCKDGPVTTGSYMPEGTIIMYCAAINAAIAGSLAPNWLPVTGQTLDNAHTQYPKLFQALVENQTLEPSNNKIKLPDLRGIFLRSCRADEVPGQTFGYQTAMPQKNPIAFNTTGAHTHSIYSGSDLGTSSHCAGHSNSYANNTTATDAAGEHAHTVTGGGDRETRPINIAVDFLIRVQNT